MTTRAGIDLCIEAVTRRREETRDVIAFHRRAGRGIEACVAASNLQTVERILADLAKIRQEAGE